MEQQPTGNGIYRNAHNMKTAYQNQLEFSAKFKFILWFAVQLRVQMQMLSQPIDENPFNGQSIEKKNHAS